MSVNIITNWFIVITESRINLMENNIVSGNNAYTLMNEIDKLS